MREGAVSNGSALTTASGGGSCAGRSPSSRSAIHSRHSVSLEPTLRAQDHPISCWNLFDFYKKSSVHGRTVSGPTMTTHGANLVQRLANSRTRFWRNCW